MKEFIRFQNPIDDEPFYPVKVSKKKKERCIRLANVKNEDTELDSPVNIRRVSDVSSPIRKVSDVDNTN